MVVVEPTPPSALEKLSTRARHLLQGSSLWVAAGGRLGNRRCLPPSTWPRWLQYLRPELDQRRRRARSLLFNVVAFALVEVPLLGYLAAPDKTRALIAALHDWIRSRRLRAYCTPTGSGGLLSGSRPG